MERFSSSSDASRGSFDGNLQHFQKLYSEGKYFRSSFMNEETFKMHGASNRFLLHFGDGNPETLLHEIGDLDGLLIVQESKKANARMRVFNADGKEAEQCGNGLRCVALHLVRSRYVESAQLTIETRAGLNQCVVHESRNEVSVTMQKPKVQSLHIEGLPACTYVNLGNPNIVVWSEADPLVQRDQFGKEYASHPYFKYGVNVHFAREEGKETATCASWERGVGATHASGTGGASVFASFKGKTSLFVLSVGGTLSYQYDSSGAIVMSGPASYL